MRINGRRIHIAGSATRERPIELLQYAHALIEGLVDVLARREAQFVVDVVNEPLADENDPSSPSIIFDWTVLATAWARLADGSAQPSGPRGRLITIVATDKTEAHVPDTRRNLWQALLEADAVDLRFAEPGWTSGGNRRVRQAQFGDVLIVLSGGEGVEHLARLYAQAGKPVIPLDLDLGSSSDDGSGGAARLAKRARAEPSRFVRLTDPGAGGTLFANLSTRGGARPVEEVVAGVVRLLEALAPPMAFYVRLLDTNAEEYQAVEDFFRRVVDPVIAEFDYQQMEMGRSSATHAWMNEAIFDNLHHAQLAIVDLTGSRPNCYMEFGYALGRTLPVLITAQEGTRVHFDARMIEYHAWSSSGDDEERRAGFREYWGRNIERPPLVKPREIL